MNRQWLRNFFLFHVQNHCISSTFKSKALQSISYCNFGEVLLVSMRIHRDTQQTKDWFSKDRNKDLQEKKIRRSFDTKKGKGGFIVYNYPMDILSTSQLPPGIGTHSFTVSSPWGEYNADYSGVEYSQSQLYHFTFHQVPITAGWTEAMWIQSLPKAFMHDQCHRESNPRPLDL